MSDSSSEEPKIIVDSDWKSQVQAEKEKLKKEQEEAEAVKDEPVTEENEAANAESSSAEEDSDGFQMPEASFSLLITQLATQAAMSLGQMPGPGGEEPKVDKAMAKHVIDTMGMLDEKTKGNLSDEEAQLLEAMLHQLRMAFMTA